MELDADLAVAERSDRLRDTIDYRQVAELIVALGTGEPHRLLESLARRMIAVLSERFPTARIRLEVRKLNPPGCAGHPAHTAVRLST